MTPAQKGTKGFLRIFGDEFHVGASDVSRNYTGPIAEVSHNDTWLHIITDQYEGAAMLNIEALPFLIRALNRIKKARRAASQTGGGQP